jgi:murein DD-endopeptidase MepM/ murein hydrolase activator NlpD
MMGFFQGNSATVTVNVTLDTKPPVIKILHSEQYISPGGAGIAVYSVDDTQSSHGVMINGRFNPGHPLGGNHNDRYISYFALPYNAENLTESYIRATDVAGNSSMLPFSTIFKKVQWEHDRINITDGFLNTKIPEFEQHYPEMSGSSMEKYLYSNSTVRDKNNKKIEELCGSPINERLWEGSFHRMPGSNRAGFANHRTYYYNDQPIDKQVHLGMDIASTQQANVPAANKGKVIYADYLGIYGNMVLLDHGQGIFSLYSHLSQINVKVGDIINANDTVGLSGTTGMAGGDHLHFSMLVNGVFSTPLEWWDPHWLAVTIERPLAALDGK